MQRPNVNFLERMRENGTTCHRFCFFLDCRYHQVKLFGIIIIVFLFRYVILVGKHNFGHIFCWADLRNVLQLRCFSGISAAIVVLVDSSLFVVYIQIFLSALLLDFYVSNQLEVLFSLARIVNSSWIVD